MDIIHRDVLAHPFKVGDVVRLDGATVTISQVAPDGGPLRANFRFDAPLASQQLAFLVWSGTKFMPFNLPAVGQVVALPAPNTQGLARQVLAQLL